MRAGRRRMNFDRRGKDERYAVHNVTPSAFNILLLKAMPVPFIPFQSSLTTVPTTH